MDRALRPFSGVAALLACLAQPLPAEAGFRTVFLSGQPAPGLPPGWEFDAFNFSNPSFQFDYPPLNGAGQSGIYAVAGNTLGSGISGGVWVGDGTGPLALVALDHTPAPGLPGLGFSPGFPALSDAGDIAFPARLEGFGVGSVNDEALYGPSGAAPLAPLAREGSPAPGMAPGVVFGPIGQFFSLSPLNPINDAGQLAFTASLGGPGITTANDAALWLTDGAGGLSLVAREGDPAPGTGAGVVFALGFSSFAVSESGHVAFAATLTGLGVTTSNDVGLWVHDGASLAVVAREGDPVPGLGAGVVLATIASQGFSVLDQNDLNGAGELAFLAKLSGPGIDASNDQAIFVREATGLRLAAREGEGGVPPGAGFVTVALNDGGEVAFETGVTFSCDAIWGPDGSGGLRVVAQAGAPIPDVPGASFTDFMSCGNLLFADPQPSINAHGEVAFTAETQDGGLGVFYASPAGELVTIAYEDGLGNGDAIEVAPGDVRTLDGWLSTHPFATLTDARQISFTSFIDPYARGLFLAELYTDCVDGIDNDGDDFADLADPGCTNEADPLERGRALECDDGLDNDGDGGSDVAGDPGCKFPNSPVEDPQCQDGINNDGQFGVDFDGGFSVTGVPGPADPQCGGKAWWHREAKAPVCGLGFESVLVLLPIAWLRARRQRA